MAWRVSTASRVAAASTACGDVSGRRAAASTARDVSAASRVVYGGHAASGRGPALLVRVLLEDLLSHVRARDWSRRRREGVDRGLRAPCELERALRRF